VFLFAGHDTTSSTIGSAVKMLIENPQYIPQVADDDSLAFSNKVFKECLRLAPPVSTSTLRELTADISLQNGKYIIPKGVFPMPMIAPYQSDPSNFSRPLEFDPNRDFGEGDLVAFSRGPRNCVGAPLAYMEGPMVIHKIFSAFQNIAFDSTKPAASFEWCQTWKWENLFIKVE
jgi:cytochrome P450